jgi:mRNA-degrading endonuclease RelE of RelBE toxin-antitoxin system
VEIIETSAFTRRVTELLPDDEYHRLQVVLVGNPELGRVIPGTGGLRKLRWSLGTKGKSGGVRIIYYWAVGRYQLLMLYIFSKGERSDLTESQKKQLARIVREEYP